MSSPFELSSEIIAAVPSQEQLADLLSWLDDLAFIDASSPKKHAVALVAARRGCSESSINHKLSRVKREGPAALLDGRTLRRARTRADEGHRSPAFRQWVAQFYFRANRNGATPEVQRQMLLHLRAWRDDPTNPDLRIPGYRTPPADSARNSYRCPDGWSLRQLNEIKPDAYNRALGGHGIHRANEMLPPVLTTRVGLHVGEVYMFDDQHLDFKVAWKPGDYVKPVGINVLDLLSGCDVTRGFRPFLKDNPDGEKSLKRDDIIWLTVDLLTFEGYYADRCRLVVEAGSSTYDPEFIRLLAYATDGIVEVDKGKVSTEQIGGLRVLAMGNPRFKAPRESWFNLFRNYTASVPMQVGKDRHHVPESTQRIEQEERALVKRAAVHDLPPSVLEQLALSGYSWTRFLPLVNAVSEHINRRTDHDLEGWASLGYEYTEYLVGSEWVPQDHYAILPPETRALVSSRMDRGELVTREAKLSPRQVYDQGRPNLRRISPFLWNKLIPARLAIPRKVPANRVVKIQQKTYGAEPVIFEPIYYPETGEPQPLPAGKDVLIFLSPIRPEFALFCRSDGSVLGVVATVQRGTRFDMDKLLFQYGQRAALKTAIGTSANAHNQALAEEREERRESNRKLLAEHGVEIPSAPRKKAPQTAPESADIFEILPPAEFSADEPETTSEEDPGEELESLL